MSLLNTTTSSSIASAIAIASVIAVYFGKTLLSGAAVKDECADDADECACELADQQEQEELHLHRLSELLFRAPRLSSIERLEVIDILKQQQQQSASAQIIKSDDECISYSSCSSSSSSSSHFHMPHLPNKQFIYQFGYSYEFCPIVAFLAQVAVADVDVDAVAQQQEQQESILEQQPKQLEQQDLLISFTEFQTMVQITIRDIQNQMQTEGEQRQTTADQRAAYRNLLEMALFLDLPLDYLKILIQHLTTEVDTDIIDIHSIEQYLEFIAIQQNQNQKQEQKQRLKSQVLNLNQQSVLNYLVQMAITQTHTKQRQRQTLELFHPQFSSILNRLFEQPSDFITAMAPIITSNVIDHIKIYLNADTTFLSSQPSTTTKTETKTKTKTIWQTVLHHIQQNQNLHQCQPQITICINYDDFQKYATEITSALLQAVEANVVITKLYIFVQHQHQIDTQHSTDNTASENNTVKTQSQSQTQMQMQTQTQNSTTTSLLKIIATILWRTSTQVSLPTAMSMSMNMNMKARATPTTSLLTLLDCILQYNIIPDIEDTSKERLYNFLQKSQAIVQQQVTWHDHGDGDSDSDSRGNCNGDRDDKNNDKDESNDNGESLSSSSAPLLLVNHSFRLIREFAGSDAFAFAQS